MAKFQTVDEFVYCLKNLYAIGTLRKYLSLLNGMSPAQYRTHSQII